MIFSERASLNLATGIRFRSDSLRSVGIYDNSQCWGLWTPNQNPPSGEDHVLSSIGDYHLVLSQFHPASWPYLIKIRVSLADDVGVLAEMAHFLMKLDIGARLGLAPSPGFSSKQCDGLNILHQDQAPTGFRHCTWTLVAEAIAVRAKHQVAKDHLDRQYPNPRRPNFGGEPLKGGVASSKAAEEALASAKKFAGTLSADMLRASSMVREALNAMMADQMKDQSSSRPFSERLARDFARSSLEPEDLLRQPRNVRDEYERFVPPAIEVGWLYELPFHAIYGGGSRAPFAFHYQSDTRILRSAGHIDYPGSTDLRAVLEPDRNHFAIATFDPSEHCLRLVPMSESTRRSRSVLMVVDYDVSVKGAPEPGLSRGLVKAVAEVAVSESLSVLSILNKTRESSVKEERGQLRLLALRTEPFEKKRKVRKRIRKKLEDIGLSWSRGDNRGRGTDCRIKAACTSPGVDRVFVSLNFSHPRQENVISLLEEVCAEYSLIAEVAKGYDREATEKVRSMITGCEGFVQLLTDPLPRGTLRTSWLDFEYGIALGRRMPRIRLVDVSTRSYDEWLRDVVIDRDRYCREIDLSRSDAELRRFLSKAVRDLAAQLRTD